MIPVQYPDCQPSSTLISSPNRSFEQQDPFHQTHQESSVGSTRSRRCTSYSRKCFVCDQFGHLTKDCPSLAKLRSGSANITPTTTHVVTNNICKRKVNFLHLN